MRYLLTRVLATVLVTLGVSVLIFILVRLLPGDIVTIMAGREGQLSAQQRQAILESFGLDRPLPVQYGLWLWNMLHGNMGISYRSGQQVAGLLASRLPLTVELALLSVLVAALIGIPLGVVAAVSPSTRIKVGSQALGVLGLSV